MISGFIKIDKESGYTSSDCDNIIKRTFNTKKCGHLGTLDPFATGLLIIGVNNGTKLLPYINDDFKEYEATLKLGIETDTLDRDGKVISIKKVPELNEIQIKDILNSFIGNSKQTPPNYSAKRIDGIHAYSLSRSGVDFTLPMIDIIIKKIELISFNRDEIKFKVTVSKGTYIRALGSDIAKRLGTIGHLISLRRTKIGDITLNDSVKIKECNEKNLLPMVELLPSYKRHICDEELYFRVKNGQSFRLPYNEKTILMIYKDEIVAVYEKINNVYHCKRGLKDDK